MRLFFDGSKVMMGIAGMTIFCSLPSSLSPLQKKKKKKNRNR
jgi:hypothetical protein